MKERRIAVLMAVYNGAPYIRAQLHSILDQEYVSVDVFVSCDLSTDGSEEIVSEFCNNDDRVKILSTSQTFGSAAKNFFYLISSVDLNNYHYVAFADQDDIWLPKKLARAASIIESKGYDCYSSDLMCFSDDGKASTFVLRKSFPFARFDHLFQGASAGCTYVLKSDFLTGISDFVVSSDFKGFSHDWLCYAFTRAHGAKWFIDDQSYILYRQHSSNVQGARLGFKGLLSKFRELQSGWYFKHIRALRNVFPGDSEEACFLNMVLSESFYRRFPLVFKILSLRRKRLESIVLALILLFNVGG